jgi:hypothetical protein
VVSSFQLRAATKSKRGLASECKGEQSTRVSGETRATSKFFLLPRNEWAEPVGTSDQLQSLDMLQEEAIAGHFSKGIGA